MAFNQTHQLRAINTMQGDSEDPIKLLEEKLRANARLLREFDSEVVADRSESQIHSSSNQVNLGQSGFRNDTFSNEFFEEDCSSCQSHSPMEYDSDIVAECLSSLPLVLFGKETKKFLEERSFDNLDKFFQALAYQLSQRGPLFDHLDSALPLFLVALDTPSDIYDVLHRITLFVGIFNLPEEEFCLTVRQFFLNIYQYIFRPITVFYFLIQLSSMSVKFNPNGKSYITLVLMFLKEWVQKRPGDFSSSPALMSLLRFFVNYFPFSVEMDDDSFLDRLHIAIDIHITEKETSTSLTSTHKPVLSRSASLDPPSKPMMKLNFEFFEISSALSKARTPRDMIRLFYETDAKVIADACTFIEAKLFLELDIFDLDPAKWSSNSWTYNQRYLHRMDSFTFFLLYVLLKLPFAYERKLMMKKYCQIIEHFKSSSRENCAGIWIFTLALYQPLFATIKSQTLDSDRLSISVDLSISKILRDFDYIFPKDSKLIEKIARSSEDVVLIPAISIFTHALQKTSEERGRHLKGSVNVYLPKLMALNHYIKVAKKMQINLSRNRDKIKPPMGFESLIEYLTDGFLREVRKEFRIEEQDDIREALSSKLYALSKSFRKNYKINSAT